MLDRAKRLKGSQFDHVFVRRDLTYAQRMELRLRRENLESRTAEPARQAASQPAEPAQQSASQPAEPVRQAASQPAESVQQAASVSHPEESKDTTHAELGSTAASEQVQLETHPAPSSLAGGASHNSIDKAPSNPQLNELARQPGHNTMF